MATKVGDFVMAIVLANCSTEEEINTETLKWACPPQHQAEHDELISTHRWAPLAIYNEDKKFVECKDAHEALCGALVEVHFTLKHYHIKKDGYNSFTAIPLQVQILKPAMRPSPIHDIRAGPLLLVGDSEPGNNKGW